MQAPEPISLLDDAPVYVEAAVAAPAMRLGGRARVGAGEFSSSGQREVVRMVRFGSQD
jgi:hypothetical protein